MTKETGQTPPPEQASSRALRRLRAIDAFIDLVLAGESPTTPADVAVRAELSRATVFRYFSTLDELRCEAATRVVERHPELFTIPAIGTKSLGQRVERFVDSRFRLHETLHALELLLRSHAARDVASSEFVEATRLGLVEQVREHFATEFAPLDPERREDLAVAISVVTSVESWQQFRLSHERSPAQTRRAWRIAVSGILGGAVTTS